MKYEFEHFWSDYDYKIGRKSAEKIWNKLQESDKQRIANHLPRYVESTNKDGTYPSRKHPSTYLNQESWNDEIIKVKSKTARGLSESTKRRIDEFLTWESSGADIESLVDFGDQKTVSRTDSPKDSGSSSGVRRYSESPGYWPDPKRGAF